MIPRPFVSRDGCLLSYTDEGRGLPVLWQHGLGADQAQPGEVFPEIDGLRRITLECRGHGRSELGPVRRITIAQFAEDCLALLDHLDIDRAVIGGISLGAAIALRIAAMDPERVLGLVLARPAWIFDAAPPRLQIYTEVADLIATRGAFNGAMDFEESQGLQTLETASPDNAASMRWFFHRRDPETTVALLSRIPLDGPNVGKSDLERFNAPALVIASGEDFVHPIETARALCGVIPSSTFALVASKSEDRRRHVQEFRESLYNFLVPLRSAA